MQTKLCKVCGNVKDIHEFSFRGNGRRRNICKSCDNARKSKHVQASVEINSTNVVDAFLHICRYDKDRAYNLSIEDFCRLSRISVDDNSFENIKSDALAKMKEMGVFEERDDKHVEGKYLVVSDSFGKHTKTEMFNLLKTLGNSLGIDRIIHLGNALDDDDDMSNIFNNFEIPVTFVAKTEELSRLYSLKNEYGFKLVTGAVQLGDILCINQETIQPYSSQLLTALNVSGHKCSVICNNTRHEYFQRATYGKEKFVASPGTLAKPFVRKVIKQIDFTDGYKVKEAYTSSMLKYRRMAESIKLWENGVILVTIVNGRTYTTPLRIKNWKRGYATAYDGVIYTDEGVLNGGIKTFVIADAHAPNMCSPSVALSKKIMEKFDDGKLELIMLGDMIDGRPVNPHTRSRNEVCQTTFLDEYRHYYNMLKYYKMNFAGKLFMFGNHEDFYKRYTNVEPQFKTLFVSLLRNPLYKFNYIGIKDKNVWESSNSDLVYTHGDFKMFGQSGNTPDKYAKTFNCTVVKGHSHSSMIARDVYSIPALCFKDQDYNEQAISSWNNGVALVVELDGVNFVQIINFYEHQGKEEKFCYINGEEEVQEALIVIPELIEDVIEVEL